MQSDILLAEKNASSTFDIELTDGEKEILILKAAMDSINSMVNFEVLTLNHNDPDSSIQFKTGIDQKYFNILLLDFLHSRIFKINEACLAALQQMIVRPIFNSDVVELQKIVSSFQVWLDQEVEFEHDGETRKLWFPAINKEIALKIKRSEFIEICGNISKHNQLGLDRQAKIIRRIFASNDTDIKLEEALLIMGEFYEQFHDDLFNYHSSTIAEYLNNIRWAIYLYIKPLHLRSIEHYLDERHKMNAWRYNYPAEIENKFVREVFWNLMNDVIREPYMPRFCVTKYMKLRY
jgi:hypothetical protein